MMPANLVSALTGGLARALFGSVAGQTVPLVARYGRGAARKFGIMLAAGFVSVIAGTASIGFLMLALWAYVRPHLGPVGAPLVLAGVAILIAIVMALVARSALRPPKLKFANAAFASQNTPSLAVELENLAGVAADAIRKQKTPVLLAALLVGVLAANQKR
jgi:hypothetical protein